MHSNVVHQPNDLSAPSGEDVAIRSRELVTYNDAIAPEMTNFAAEFPRRHSSVRVPEAKYLAIFATVHTRVTSRRAPRYVLRLFHCNPQSRRTAKLLASHRTADATWKIVPSNCTVCTSCFSLYLSHLVTRFIPQVQKVQLDKTDCTSVERHLCRIVDLPRKKRDDRAQVPLTCISRAFLFLAPFPFRPCSNVRFVSRIESVHTVQLSGTHIR